jgi:hypothetical protein
MGTDLVQQLEATHDRLTNRLEELHAALAVARARREHLREVGETVRADRPARIKELEKQDRELEEVNRKLTVLPAQIREVRYQEVLADLRLLQALAEQRHMKVVQLEAAASADRAGLKLEQAKRLEERPYHLAEERYGIALTASEEAWHAAARRMSEEAEQQARTAR